MAKTVVRDNESLDDALRRFKRQVSRTGTLQEARKRDFGPSSVFLYNLSQIIDFYL